MKHCSGPTIRRADFLNIAVHPLTIVQLNEFIADVVNQHRRGCIIANHNLHSIYLVHQEEKMRAFYDLAERVHIDGMGVVLLGRLMNVPLQRWMRVTYIDWLPELLKCAASSRWRVFYLGSKPGVAEAGAERFRYLFPELQIRTHHGYFDIVTDSNHVTADIESYSPNLLLVGMGMPRQEQWIADNYQRLSANVILTAGAAMDYFAGEARTPPRWVGKLGFEWAYRLSSEPTRLWKRYLLEPWFLLRLLLREPGSVQVEVAQAT